MIAVTVEEVIRALPGGGVEYVPVGTTTVFPEAEEPSEMPALWQTCLNAAYAAVGVERPVNVGGSGQVIYKA